MELHMGKAIAAGLLMIAAASSTAAAAPRKLTGAITRFECGDNCYLTIDTGAGEKTGLCEAKACAPWFENQEMPKKFIGKRVTVTVGTGKQYDGNYTVVGRTTAFKKLEFEKSPF
jgi:hypothetical protein